MSPAELPVHPDLAATLGYVPPRATPPLSLVLRLCTPVTPDTVPVEAADAADRLSTALTQPVPAIPHWAVLSLPAVLCLALVGTCVGFLFVRSFV